MHIRAMLGEDANTKRKKGTNERLRSKINIRKMWSGGQKNRKSYRINIYANVQEKERAHERKKK